MSSFKEDDKVKRAHSKDRFTDNKILEVMQCMDDPVYFMESFMRVQHPIKGDVPFKLYDFQKRLVDGFHNHRFAIALCARQLGKTSVAVGYLLWKAIFSPDVTILITANKLEQALEIMKRLRFAYENLPDHIRPGVVEYNKGSILFDNGSQVVSRATSADAGRGLAVSLLYCDEFAFVPPNKAQEFWTSIQPTLSEGGACIITSTPKNDEDQFAQIWKGANDNTDEYGNTVNENGEGKNGFFPIKVRWAEHPLRDEAWAKPFRESLGEARFRQEYEAEFISDDETLIDPLTLARMSGRQPEFYTGTVRWYADPQPNKTYLVSLDPSLGSGGDFAAIQVFMVPEMVQIAEWQHNLSVARFQVRTMMQVLLYLQQTLIEHPDQFGTPEIYWTVENNTIGEAVLQIIEDTGEERFPGNFVSERKRKGQVRRFRKGFNTDNKKKLSACAKLKSMIESGRMKINSPLAIRQLKNFVAKEVTYEAKPGEYDDLVSALLLICRMLDVVVAWSLEKDVDVLREMIDPEEAYTDAMPVSVLMT